MSKTRVRKHGTYKPTPIDNVRWSAVMTVLFLTGLFCLGLILLALR